MARVFFAMRSRDGEVREALSTIVDDMSSMADFFRELEPEFWRSREAVYETQGEASETPWPLYSQTQERLRYIFAKGNILGADGPVGDDDVLMWGGPGRLRLAVTGQSSEGRWYAEELAARVVIDVPYASNHDEGQGVAPEWAWPKGVPYDVPERRLSALGGRGPDGFQRMFAERIGEHLGEGAVGLKSADLTAELMQTWGVQ